LPLVAILILAGAMSLESLTHKHYVSTGLTAQQATASQRGSQITTMDIDMETIMCRAKSFFKSRRRGKRCSASLQCAVEIVVDMMETCEGRHNVPHNTVGFVHRIPRRDPNDVGRSGHCPQPQQIDLRSDIVVSL